MKRAADYNIRVRPKADGSEMKLAGIKMSMNPFDEITVEAAERLVEADQAKEVVAVSIASAACQETLRTAMAMGADRSILVDTDNLVGHDLQSLAVAKLLATVAAEEKPDLILLGKQAIDDTGQTGQMLAAMLGMGQGTFASAIAVEGGSVRVTREIDGELETVDLKFPAVVTTDLRLNEPRYATLPNIMKAKKKPLVVTTPGNQGVDPTLRLKLLRVAEPRARSVGVRVDSVAALVAHLKQAQMI